MTKQEILDTIDKEFKGKAMSDYGDCFYLMEDGRKCAIGLFIPDNHEAQKYRWGIRELLRTYPSLLKHMPSKDLDFLEDFQNWHDNLHHGLSVEDQKQELKDFVERNF